MTTTLPDGIVNREDLPGERSQQFQGYLFGDTPISFYWTDAPPGSGPALDTHPYHEIFIIDAGQATFVRGEDTIEARGGQVIIVPLNTPQKFTNSGTGQLRQVSIHTAPKMTQTDLE